MIKSIPAIYDVSDIEERFNELTKGYMFSTNTIFVSWLVRVVADTCVLPLSIDTQRLANSTPPIQDSESYQELISMVYHRIEVPNLHKTLHQLKQCDMQVIAGSLFINYE